MAQELKTRKRSTRLIEKKQKQHSQPPVSHVPSQRAHLAQKSLYDSRGKPTGIEVVIPPLPTPSPEDVLYCGPEPDYQAVYFSLYDKLAWDCHGAESSGHVDSAVLKEKAKLTLQAIENTTQLINNKHIRDVFNHLAQLISDHFIYPTKIKLKHLKRFLLKTTTHQREVLDEDLVLPLISALEKFSFPEEELTEEVIPPLGAINFEALTLGDSDDEIPTFEEIAFEPQKKVKEKISKPAQTDPFDNGDDLKPLPLENISFDELEDEPLPDEFPAHMFLEAPKVIWVRHRTPSYTKITATLEEVNVIVTKKRPESPNSEETISPTPSHYELTRVHELGLRKKTRVNYQEESEKPKVCRNTK